MDKVKRQKLKKFIRELEGIRGRHTELVSVYIPAGYDMNNIISHLSEEQSTAMNIKDKTTRKNVMDSLERAIRHLRLFKRTPENGLALFSGNASNRQGQQDIQVWSIEPSEPLGLRLYRCDQTFVLDPLKAYLEDKNVYGLIVLDRREGNIGVLKGSVIREIASHTSAVPGKTKAGGQSSQRFERIRDEMAKEFFKRVADSANREFLEMKGLKGIIIGGPTPTKEDFFDGNFLNNEVKKKVLGLKDLSYTGDFGLRELVDKSADLLKEEAITEEKQIMERFLQSLAKTPEKTAYGLAEVKKALALAAVDVLLLSESLDDNLIEELDDQAEAVDTEVKIISLDTHEGMQLKELGGIGALLRFQLPQ
jgi:peptide chain release factor subunit 1